jgi:outer membrane lipoprotein SlyB
MKPILCLIGVALLLGACTRNISPDTYSVGSVGMATRTIRATIISVRDVKIEGNRTGIGAGAGATGGAVAGSAIGGNARGNILGAIGGAVAGGIAGAAIEEGTTRQTGLEYVVETETDHLLTVVQGPEPRLSKGEKVLVMYGNPTRIISLK